MQKKTKTTGMEGELLPENVMIKPAIRRQFEEFMRQGRVLFFSAPCGFGKTTVAETLLAGKAEEKTIYRLNTADTGFSLPKPGGGTLSEPDGSTLPKSDGSTLSKPDGSTLPDWDILLIDDLQMMQDEDDWQTLCQLIRTQTAKRFMLLSRGAPPGCMMAFQYAGIMKVLEAEDLLFDWNDINRTLQLYHVEAESSEITEILKASIGYPLGVMITARHMAAGRAFGPEIVARSYREVFSYFEAAVYRRFDLPMRHFLLELAPFEQFDLEMARMVSGNPHAGDMIDQLLENTTLLRYDDMDSFRFWDLFRDFLLWELEREYTEEKRKALFSRGGLYYELKEDYAHALECYTMGGDHSKVSDLLVRNAELHPGMGHYSEMEKYYRSLPESEILASPSLMQGMSMLCALATDYEGSERWYRELQEYVKHCEKQDAAGKQARGRLAWLDISLPQRGAEGLTTIIPAVFQLLTNKEVTLPAFSITSALPSLMNGGKDFSEWSPKDDLLYKTIRVPVEVILGKDGVGLADYAVAESKFEKGEDISGRMLKIISSLNDIRQRGTPDMEFAVGGLLARSQIASGQSEDAYHTITTLREQFEERGLTRFLPNMDALLCRMDLLTGNWDKAEEWYRRKAPKDLMNLNVMKRYQYFTQAMAELTEGRYDVALLTLAPFEEYVRNCARHIDSIHLNVLTAIALHRKKETSWQERLDMALDTAEKYKFIRCISVYGGAVLPLLKERSRTGKWFHRLMLATKTQAAFYPDFLEGRMAPQDTLTLMELQILHLICADKSNAEIAQMMDIKLPTVKTHVSHILTKLGVSRRSEAKTVAKKLRLVPEHFIE